MRVSEATTTNKRVLSLNKIKGVDLSSAPLRVKETRASWINNMISKDGTNHKRNGFEEIARFYDEDGLPLKINGITSLGANNNDFIYIHAGENLYGAESDFSKIYDLGKIGTDKKCSYFPNDGYMYILADNRLLFYNGKMQGEEASDTIYPLFDGENAYVPTTSIGITDTAHGSLMQSFEGVNLFNTKRINKLTGTKNGTTYPVEVNGESYDIFTLDKSEGMFHLDGEIDLSKPVKITANTYISNSSGPCSLFMSAYTMYVDDNGEEKESNTFNKEIKTIFAFEPGEQIKEGTSTLFIGDEKKEIVRFKEITPGLSEISGYKAFEGCFKAEITNKNGRGVVTFTPALPSSFEGEDNITVEYYTKQEAPSIKAACECSVNTYSKMLAVVTEDDIVYYSSPSEGYSYFPDNNYIKAINNVSSLIAGGNFLGVASKDELAIISFSIDSSGEKIVCVPSLVKKHRDVGCISACSQAYVEGDTLFLSSKGVYGASLSDIFMRSSNINKELLSLSEDTLKNAVALEHDGRYYLFVDGIVYIADARYKTYESNRLDVSYEYEWWRWSDCPCRVAINDNGRLLLGREDGRIMLQGEGYSDITYYELSESEELTDGNSFIFSEELEISPDDKIKIEGAYKYLVTGTFEYLENNQARVVFEDNELISILHKGILLKGDTIRIYVKAQRIATDVVIEELSLEEKSIYFAYTPEVSELQATSGAAIYGLCDGEKFSAHKNEETTSQQWDYILKDALGEQAYFMDFDNIKITIIRKRPVMCELYTAVLNFGTDVKKKILHKLVFVPGVQTGGEVIVGYETNKRNVRRSQMVGEELDFSLLDFHNFTFDSAFYNTFEKRVHERNVEFVRFQFRSHSDSDFSIENFSCVYSLNSR